MSILRGPAQLADLQGALCVPTFNLTCGVDGRTERNALLSQEPGGDQGALFTRNVVQSYVRVCVSSFMFCVLYLFYFVFFRLNTSSPSGAVGVATFHPGYLSFPRRTPRLADGPQEVFRMTSPLC